MESGWAWQGIDCVMNFDSGIRSSGAAPRDCWMQASSRDDAMKLVAASVWVLLGEAQ